jgi:hypothetical protein
MARLSEGVSQTRPPQLSASGFFLPAIAGLIGAVPLARSGWHCGGQRKMAAPCSTAKFGEETSIAHSAVKDRIAVYRK